MQEKIDIVYTWVDGLDPIWREKRRKAISDIENIQEIEQHGNLEERFRDNGEIKYSLRSLEKYFPEHGKIFIITDDQVPDFIRNHDDVIIIDHKDFMDISNLPTFSSKHIESYLIDIPGLSEVFIYMNDDLFFGPDFQIADLLNEKPVYYFVPWKNRDIHPIITSAASSENFLRKYYADYVPMSFSMAHTPRTIIKQDFSDMRQEFIDIFKKVSGEKFRDITNPSLLSDMYPRWMIHHKKGIIGVKKDIYVKSSDDDYNGLLDNFSQVPFFCINDTSDNKEKNDPSLQKISQVLQNLFPDTSSFEKL